MAFVGKELDPIGRITSRCRPTSGAPRFRPIATLFSRRSRLIAKPFGGQLGSLLPKARTCTFGPMSYHDIITIEPDKRGWKTLHTWNADHCLRRVISIT